MKFEFDPAKSSTNKKKHGIDFEEIKALWEDERLLEVPAKTIDELRYVVIGKLNGKFWSVVITYRGDRIRIISARRSRDKEIALYEGK
ncbi:MAG: BrnT family toxin [Symploca sp. SIO1B1]|nr:BrnT family toxin [Symploca sp. SIO1B1]